MEGTSRNKGSNACVQGLCPPESCELCGDPQIKCGFQSARVSECVSVCVCTCKRERAKIEVGWGHTRILFHSPICTQLSQFYVSSLRLGSCNSQRMTHLLYSPPDPTVSSKLEPTPSAGAWAVAAVLGWPPLLSHQQPSSVPSPVVPPTGHAGCAREPGLTLLVCGCLFPSSLS